MRNGSLWITVFEKEVFHYNSWIWFRDLTIIRIWGPEILHVKAHNFVWQTKVFFLPILSRNFDDYLSSNCYRFVMHDVALHQKRRLIFDNNYYYQGFPVFFNNNSNIMIELGTKTAPKSTNSWWLRGAMKRDSPVYWIPTHYVVYSLVLDHCPNTFRYGLFVAKVCWQDV